MAESAPKSRTSPLVWIAGVLAAIIAGAAIYAAFSVSRAAKSVQAASDATRATVAEVRETSVAQLQRAGDAMAEMTSDVDAAYEATKAKAASARETLSEKKAEWKTAASEKFAEWRSEDEPTSATVAVPAEEVAESEGRWRDVFRRDPAPEPAGPVTADDVTSEPLENSPGVTARMRGWLRREKSDASPATDQPGSPEK